MKEDKKVNKSRSKTFGIVINPLLKDQVVDWRSLGVEEKKMKLKELSFPTKYDILELLNQIEFKNVNERMTGIEDFEAQFELGTESGIPHYQLAILTKSVCTKKPILESLQESLNAFINIDIQFDFENMKRYCTKDSEFFSEEYSGRIFKHNWKLNFIERKPELKQVLENPYPWQKFFLEQVISVEPDSRVVDWLVDPVGNTGKSSFARAYVSKEPTDAIILKIDNLDRMELSLIQKITNYRDRYSKDPRIIFLDFPRAADQKKVMAATALMEDAKSGHLETSFGGKLREVQISNVHVVVMANSAPDLSVLSVDRWRIWRLGGPNYDNIMWPCKPTPELSKYDSITKNVKWSTSLDVLAFPTLSKMSQYENLKLDPGWLLKEPTDKESLNLPVFAVYKQYTKTLVNSIYDAPNEIKLMVFDLLESNGLLTEFDEFGKVKNKRKVIE